MQFTLSLTDKIDPIAVYAACVATLVFVWNIYVWATSGPRLRVTAVMNMMVIGGRPDQDGKMFLSVRATNVGAKKTTVSNVLIFSYKNLWQRFRSKPEWTAIFNNTGGNCPLPFVLDVGHDFSSLADQEDIADKIRDTYFYAGIQHSFARKPVMVRVKFKPQKIPRTTG